MLFDIVLQCIGNHIIIHLHIHVRIVRATVPYHDSLLQDLDKSVKCLLNL